MQRIMFSGGSSPSMSPHRQQTPQEQQLCVKLIGAGLGHRELYENEVPKTDHGKLGGHPAAPRVRVLDRGGVYGM
jgi:hypothetical protein